MREDKKERTESDDRKCEIAPDSSVATQTRPKVKHLKKYANRRVEEEGK